MRLHRARAKAKRELHPAIDERLLRMLKRVVAQGQPDVRVTAVEREGQTLAAAIRIYHHDTCWFYNTGFDPSAARLSPGLLVQLHSIREAIDEGLRWADLGQGDFAYKRALGGRPINRMKLDLTSPSAAGRAMRWASMFRQHAEQSPRLRAAARAARRTMLDRKQSLSG